MKIRWFYPLAISTFYWLGIERIVGGIFELGRYTDLLQRDLIIFGIYELLRFQRIRWKRLMVRDRKEEE